MADTTHHESRTETTASQLEATEPVLEVGDEVLVEEVSIDGMCGVY